MYRTYSLNIRFQPSNRLFYLSPTFQIDAQEYLALDRAHGSVVKSVVIGPVNYEMSSQVRVPVSKR